MVHSTGKATAFLLIVAALLVTLASGAAADRRINNEDYPGTFEQGGASIAVGPAGDYIVTWCDQRSGVPLPYLQQFSSDGTPIGANSQFDENSLYTFGNWWVSAPEVAENASGVIAIVAPTKRADMLRHVALWIFDADGSLAAGPIQVSDTASGGGGDYEPFGAAVDINDAGQICVAWYEYRHHLAFARWYDQDGFPASDIFSLSTAAEGSDTTLAYEPVKVDLNNSGRAVVSTRGLLSHALAAVAWILDYGSTDFQPVALDQSIIYGGDTTYALGAPALVLLDDGSFAAVLFREIEQIETYGYHILGRDVIFQRFDQNGTKVGSGTTLSSWVDSPDVWVVSGDLVLIDGAYLFAGYSYVDLAVYGRRIGLDGSVSGDALTFDLGSDSPKVTELSLVKLANGDVTICWQGTGEDGRGNVLVRTFNPITAQPVDNSRRVHDDIGSNQTTPDLASGPIGTMFTVWIDDRTGSRKSVWGRRTSVAGTPLGEPFQISQQTGYAISDVSIAGNGTGQAIVVWTAWANASYVPEKIYGQILAAPNFTPVGNNFILSDPAHNSSDFDADVAMAYNNTFIVAYRGTTVDNTTARPYDVYIRRFSATGSPLTDALMVNTEGSEDVDDAFSEKMSPTLAMKPDGSFAVVWSEYLSSVPITRHYPTIRLYSANATPVSEPMQASSSTYASSNRPYAAVNADDQYAIGFSGLSGSGGSIVFNGPWIQVMSAAGTFLSDYIKMNVGEQDRADSPALVATGPDGNFVVVYEVPKIGSVPWEFKDFDIWACRFTPTGQLLGARRIINSDDTETDQTSPAVLIDGDHAVIAWQDGRNLPGNTDIYVRYLPWDELNAPFGDVDQNGETNISDLTFLVDWLFRGGVPPTEAAAADINTDGTLNISDVTALVIYLFM